MTNHSYKLVALGLCTALVVSACDKKEEAEEVPLRTVRYATVSEASSDRIRKFTGVSESDQEAKLSFKVSGTLTKLNVAVGDTISSGQVIAEVDASTFALQLQQSEADLARAKAEQRNAEATYQRIRGLYENNSTSKDDLDTARAGAESAEAQVNAAIKAVDLARLNLSYTKLIAKTDCSVATTSSDVGENITAGQEIVLVNCGEDLNIKLSVPENAISDFAAGIPASILFDSISNSTYGGAVSEVGVAATGTTFPVTVSIDETSGLRAGLSAEVSFIFGNQVSASPTVPPSSVGEDEIGRYVFVVNPSDKAGQGTIERRPVEVGNIVSEGIEITSGIAPGDKVVTAGVSIIRDGLLVKTD